MFGYSMLLCVWFSSLVVVSGWFFSWGDPDNDVPTCQLVTSKGYPCTEYTVTTDDGYVLIIHRIPHGVNSTGNNGNGPKPVVYLQHGLLDSSATWVINFPKQSLGFLLADAGYDVWMGNVRGNTYGQSSTNYTPDQLAFWNFTFDEMAKYDLPAMVEFILSTTGQPNLYYVGHSQGTLIGFIQYSQNPTWAQSKIKQFHALAPIVWLNHTTSALKYIASYSNDLVYFSQLIGEGAVGQSSYLSQMLGTYLCSSWFQYPCEDLLQFISGYDKEHMNSSRNSVYFTHNPAGTSMYNIAHFAQFMDTKKFQAMDWGDKNQQIYGTPNPPQYSVKPITVPIALYYGDVDVFADPTDVQYLQGQLGNLIGTFRYPDMDHMDFVWGLNAPAEAYVQLMQIIAADLGNQGSG